MSEEPPNPTLLAELHALRTALESTGAYIFSKDLQGRYTYVSDKGAALVGHPVHEVIGQTDQAFYPPDMYQAVRQMDMQVMQDGQVLTVEERNRLGPSAEERTFKSFKVPMRDANGSIIGLCGIATEITAERELEASLDEQRQLLDTVLNNVDACIYMKTRERRYLYVNRKTAELYGRAAEDIIGKHESEVMGVSMDNATRDLDEKTFATQTKQAGEETVQLRDGGEAYYWSIKVPLGHLGKPDQLIGFSTDITELRLLRQDLERQAYFDGLTGVSTRRHFFAEAKRIMAEAQRYAQPLSLIAVDLDYFKNINDSYGHAAGDAVLECFANYCKSTIREADLMGRIGGEEFAILLPNTASSEAAQLAERLRKGISQLAVSVADVSEPLRFTASFGVVGRLASKSADAQDIQAMIQRADQALYQAKDSGRNRVCAVPTPN